MLPDQALQPALILHTPVDPAADHAGSHPADDGDEVVFGVWLHHHHHDHRAVGLRGEGANNGQ